MQYTKCSLCLMRRVNSANMRSACKLKSSMIQFPLIISDRNNCSCLTLYLAESPTNSLLAQRCRKDISQHQWFFDAISSTDFNCRTICAFLKSYAISNFVHSFTITARSCTTDQGQSALMPCRMNFAIREI
jgi:hypothetical protein